jgi:hypothetical protein
MLFSDRSVWTMVHGIVLGGAALMALSAALFSLYTAGRGAPPGAFETRALGRLTTFIAVALWLTVLGGTYIVFPPYRATPPAGVTDLAQYPRALIMSSPDTRWLHAFAMETKEHVPWIAAMLATAVAFVAVRYDSALLTDRRLRRTATALLALCLVLVAYLSLLGVFVNKVAPLQ